MSNTCTRRTFVSTAAVIAAASAAACPAVADEAGGGYDVMSAWLGEEPETPETFDEEIEVEVVVLGGGIAGVSACRSAIEAGATVVLFEKSSTVSGRSQDFYAIGSSWLEKNFPSIPKKDEIKWPFIQATVKGSLNRPKDAIWSRWVDINGEAFDWFVGAFSDDELSFGSEENGNTADLEKNCVTIKVWPMPSTYDPSSELYPCYAGTAVMSAAGGTRIAGFVQANFDRTVKEGGNRFSYRFDARAEKLLTEGGRVTGAVIRCYDGTLIKAVATKGLVLATGDFLNNIPMLEYYSPKTVRCGYTREHSIYTTFDVEGEHCNVGDGHKMALWAGARMQADGCCMTHMEKQVAEVIGTDPCLWLDLRGKRFMNEDCQACHMSQRLDDLPGKKIFQIFDGNILSELDRMPYGHHRTNAQTQEDLDAACEAGGCLRADTLEELFAQVEGIDAEAAIASVERYNELCAKGSDDDFGKTPPCACSR